MLSGPEIARLLQDFQEVDVKTLVIVNESHHEESISFQNSFNEKVTHLRNAFEEVGTPFLESGKELFSFETNLIKGEANVRFELIQTIYR